MTHFPPTDDLKELAKHINTKLDGASVTFFVVDHEDGRALETGIVYCHGVRRAVKITPDLLTKHNTDEIIAAMHDWVAGATMAPGLRWTTDPAETAWRS
jgi:hypothetical protein